MGKIKALIISAAAIACPFLAGSGGAAGQALHTAAYISAGVIPDGTAAGSAAETATFEGSFTESAEAMYTEEPYTESNEAALTAETGEADLVEQSATESGSAENSDDFSPIEGQPMGSLISRNIMEYDDGLDLTAEGTRSGVILREHYGVSEAPDYITLSSGAQVRNCTELDNEELLEAAESLPDFRIEAGSSEPQVLIIHTHTTESYEPYTRDYYDADFPSRTLDSSRNMTAVGEAMAQELAAHGISVLHDGTIHDYPVYTGAYDRSEETILAALEEYPSIKIVIDLHRDAIENADGSRVAPVAEIDGQSAAQFMIIAGCDNGQFNMPNYMENFRFACLIQNAAEELYPGLARPVLFDYRNYNQHLTTGSLLIEVGGHANSFDEAMYTGKLLGDVLARAVESISE